MMHAMDCSKLLAGVSELAGIVPEGNTSTKEIYMDYNGSALMPDQVRDAMIPFLAHRPGTPSRGQCSAAPASRTVANARTEVAKLIGATPEEVVFTSGATEANTFALKAAARSPEIHIVASAIEHEAVLQPLRYLKSRGARVTFIPVDTRGIVDVERLKDAVRPHTTMVSVMHVNNEVGTIQPIREIADIAHKHGALMHCDAAQSVGKIPVCVDEMDVDLLSIAAHKIGGPNGIGALYVRQGCTLTPLMHGAGHERGLPAGTGSALLAAGFGTAARLARNKDNGYVRLLRDYFWNRLTCMFGKRVVLNGHPVERVPNTLSISFPGHVGADIMARMPNVAAKTGSTNRTECEDMSHVLIAMGASVDVGLGTIRFSLGETNSCDEIDQVVARLQDILG